MEQEKVIQIKDLKVYYKNHKRTIFGKNRKKQVIKGVSIDVYEGEILGIAGESGCGKSTLAKAIVGMNKDIEGLINLKYSDTQMVFQDPYSSLNPSKKIGWLLEEPLKVDKNKDWTPGERKEKALEIMPTLRWSETESEHWRGTHEIAQSCHCR